MKPAPDAPADGTVEALLDAYLDRACRGLSGAARHEVREELRANLVQCALDHETGGLPPREAALRALAAFGPPGRVSLGMWRVHTLPRLAQTLLLVLSLGSAGLGAFSWSRAQAQLGQAPAPERHAAPAPEPQRPAR